MAFEGCDSYTKFLVSHPIPGQTDIYGNPMLDRALDDENWANIESQRLKDGIYYNSANYFKVEAAGGMNIIVRQGYCLIKSRDSYTKGDITRTVEAAGPTARTDRVVLRIDLTDDVRDVRVVIKKGTTALTNTSTIKELGIADITVAAGAQSIVSANIKDLRLDAAACGVVDYIYKLDTAKYFTQFDAILADLKAQMANQQTQYDAQTASQTTAFNNAQTQRANDYATWKATIDAWKNLTVAQLATAVGFVFSNDTAYPGTYKTFDDSVASTIKEEMRYTSNAALFASQTTVFNADGSISVTEVVYQPAGTVFRNVKATTTFPNGAPRTEVVQL